MVWHRPCPQMEKILMTSYNWAIIGPGGIAHDFARDLELMHPSQSVSAVLGHTRHTLNKFCAEFWIRKIIRKVMMVVPVLRTSCQFSE